RSEDKDGKLQPSHAEQRFIDGLNEMETVLEKHPSLAVHDTYIDEILLAAHYWKTIQQYNDRQPPESFPLMHFILRHASRQPDIERTFILENRSSF
ncbi:MAG: hypothetical protein GY758_23630, partial [Fuerstiella sp.]|nr:hypothetical protein [Fuerstiella sp.]